jgi:hypothetical protein
MSTWTAQGSLDIFLSEGYGCILSARTERFYQGGYHGSKDSGGTSGVP